jgi:hypothetical protein
VPRRATPDRARRAGTTAARSHAARKAVPAIAEEAPSFEAGKSFEPPPNGRSPLSPAESAGLGLDLPL